MLHTAADVRDAAGRCCIPNAAPSRQQPASLDARKLSHGTLGVQRLIDAISGHFGGPHCPTTGTEEEEDEAAMLQFGDDVADYQLQGTCSAPSALHDALIQATVERGYFPRTRSLDDISPPRSNPFNDSACSGTVMYPLAMLDDQPGKEDQSGVSIDLLASPQLMEIDGPTACDDRKAEAPGHPDETTSYVPQRLYMGTDAAAAADAAGERREPWSVAASRARGTSPSPRSSALLFLPFH